jgi:hypothetical protein
MRLAAATLALNRATPGDPPIAVIFIDAKGLPTEDRDTFCHLAADAGATRIHTWPEQPIDGFTGSRGDLRERLSGLWDRRESAYHQAEAVAMLDLALHTNPTPRTLSRIVDVTRPRTTAAILESSGTTEALDLKARAEQFTPTQWNGLHLRLAALHATVGNTLDAGPASRRLADIDAAWISIPGTRSPQTAADVATWFLNLVSDHATSDRSPQRTLVILDEFSAVGSDDRVGTAAAGLIERTRSAGVGIVLSAQTTESLGEAGPRLLKTAGAVLSHRTPTPEDLVELAGTETVWEDSHDVSGSGLRTAQSGRPQQQFAVPPNLVRRLPPGEAVFISHGLWSHIQIAHQRH